MNYRHLTRFLGQRRFTGFSKFSITNRCQSTSEAGPSRIELLFIDPKVQSILKDLTVSQSVLEQLPSNSTKAPEISLMTREEFDQLIKNTKKHNRKAQLRMPPALSSRNYDREVKVLGEDGKLSGHSTRRYSFVDISLNIPDQDRLVYSREPDGTLITANHSDRRRWMQIFLNRPYRTVAVPRMFEPEFLERALESRFYYYILNRACWQFEPDDPDFIRVCTRVYRHISNAEEFASLEKTRFFGPMVFYLCWYRETDNLLCYYLSGSVERSAQRLLRLLGLMWPELGIDPSSEDLQAMLSIYEQKACKDVDKLQLCTRL